MADRDGAPDAADGGGAGFLLQLSGVVRARRDGMRGRAGVLGVGGRRAGGAVVGGGVRGQAVLGETSQAGGVLRRRAAPDAAGDGYRLQAGGTDSRGRARGESARDWAEERIPDRRGGQRGDGVAARNAGAEAAEEGGLPGVAVRPGWAADGSGDVYATEYGAGAEVECGGAGGVSAEEAQGGCGLCGAATRRDGAGARRRGRLRCAGELHGDDGAARGVCRVGDALGPGV